MALFSDGPISSIDELVQYDSFLISVASVEGIDVTAKLSLAYNELKIELEALFLRSSSIYSDFSGTTPLDTDHLAVSASLKAWHCFRALELVYRDAYFNQLNDRYKGKWTEYQSLGRWAMGRFLETGAGLVADPLKQPAPPSISLETSSQAGGTFYVSATLINSSREESTPAIATQVNVADGKVAVVRLTDWPSNAIGWNVYGGASPSLMTLQNEEPVPTAASWQYPLPGSLFGRKPGTGQEANISRDLPRRIMRG